MGARLSLHPHRRKVRVRGLGPRETITLQINN